MMTSDPSLRTASDTLKAEGAGAPQALQPPLIPADDAIQLVEETLRIDKRDVLAGKVRVTTRTETREEVAEVSLDRHVVEVTRVPVGKVVEVTPAVRTENDTTIVPVVEERLVLVKQLVLTEEVHIRHRVEREVARTPVELRRQVAIVERIGPDGRVTRGDETPSTS